MRTLGITGLAVALGLTGCGSDTDGPAPTTVEVTVTQTAGPAPSPSESTTVESVPAPQPAPEPVEDDDSGWFAEADYACSLAIEEYATWKAQAGDGAAPEALAIGAASAATRAAEAIESLPEPTSPEALDLRDAVSEWAASYRDLAIAMDSGTYTEVMSAGDAAIAAADLVRVSGLGAPACAAMVDDV